MTRKLGLALALALGCTVALAGFCALSTGHTPAAPGNSAQSPASDDQILGQDDCLCDFFIAWVIPQVPDICLVAFGVKHIEQSDICCNHAAGYIGICVNGGWHVMTSQGTEPGSCDKEVFVSGLIPLPNGVQASWWIVDSASTSCTLGPGTYTPHCQ